MSNESIAIKNKYQNRHSRVNIRQYLSNIAEPAESIYYESLSELEDELLGNSGIMKHRIRQTAHNIRSHFK